MISRNQIIAKTTYQQVVAVKDIMFPQDDKVEQSEKEASEKRREKLHKNYATIAHKLPAMILQNGLPQATGFLLSKASEDAHAKLLDHLLAVFKKVDNDFDGVHDRDAFHKTIIGSDLKEIMRYTREALEISGWLRRYVQGVLKRGATGDTEGASHD
ncbi:type III-B CRISPR module-associated protein Cmr5 [Vibrio palustris]|uniref:CRISPR type III-B/RAMP module-associated protein Cmr5 n=1 Tax=Vibrio palustris TaxID=1918946 RepID=A0A1R4B2S9_9VIBR|nr:type III-B CRISPR module-associated protein Cmr5 [Vibrio palustris]SJL83230.1 CRISPR-associated protein (Cas_Cmr5) [Vibrio palustris]